MKAFPDELLKLYPQLGPLPARPWWRGRAYRDQGHAYEWHRRDGARVYFGAWGGMASENYAPPSSPLPNVLVESSTPNHGASWGDVVAVMERIDREHPLPFPGVRVGQVWACRYPPPSANISGGWYIKFVADFDHPDDPGIYGVGRIGSKPADECLLLSGPGAPWSPPEEQP